MKFKFLTNSGKKYLLWLTLGSATIINLAIMSSFIILKSNNTSSARVTRSEQTEMPKAVSGLGILEPQGEVIQVSAPAFAEGTRVARLLVKVGDRIKEGQKIAILDSHSRLEAALKKARTRVLVTQAKLRQVKAGAKVGEINAHKVHSCHRLYALAQWLPPKSLPQLHSHQLQILIHFLSSKHHLEGTL